MTFADLVKDLRKKAGLTQEDLARRSGLGLGTVRDYEQDKKEPVLRSALKLARALGVSADVFFQCVEDDNPTPRGRPRKSASESEPSKKPRKRKEK